MLLIHCCFPHPPCISDAHLFPSGFKSSLSADVPSIKLVDGNSSCSGQVQVLRSDLWGSVCLEGWDLTDAGVVCRELGCGEVTGVKIYRRQAIGKIWMNKVSCGGNESSLAECASGTSLTMGCLNNLYAGVSCWSAIRLVNGSNPCSGRVEVLHNALWGTVCDDYWNKPDAAVACREMGCGDVIDAMKSAYFGKGSGQIWMDNVHCSGSEDTLSKCPFNSWGIHDCVHGEDAGVICHYPLRLVDGDGVCSGRVEVFHNSDWASVGDNGWDLSDAAVVCREVGCGEAVEAKVGSYFGDGTSSLLMNYVSCVGSESALMKCNFDGWLLNSPLSVMDNAGVVCKCECKSNI
ncbi:hypothetical protein DNTS_003108 [Danionella cerebrum]|uniref:Soluble scavenger receptor cysteine-rich domain-containing protein SSC5D n=1 Tax=Danionella cerebrum TaxID=2873325 RepID=A0A553N0E9_9TELE|nr:hypothetical protein DNTS_003108 [Danionella translucida]